MSFLARMLGGGAANRVDGDAARNLLNDGATLLDVRTVPEFQERALPSAVNIPLHVLPARLGELDKNGVYVLYCRSGARSGQAAALLQREGFANVYDLGSIMSW